ncbi:Ca2+-binding RTX toxin-like protein [Microvirga subterranea]|uniref:Ca2+-binding RTX toxin-like protein n=1 Tax=Microvirga subterranea TaxID=186651 RepID=A0A370HJS9_9HYPH|nr:Ca2+-binding RTX toxin-like protein [Microvirga subterranea]
MAFSLEELMGFFFDNSGGGGIWYGGTGISYGPIANGIATGGTYPGGTYESGSSYPPSGGSEAGGSDVPIKIEGKVIVSEHVINNQRYLEDSLGKLYIVNPRGKIFVVPANVNVDLLMSQAELFNALLEGSMIAVPVDAGTIYLHLDGSMYTMPTGSGVFMPVAAGPLASIGWDLAVVGPTWNEGLQHEQMWETITTDHGTFWLNTWFDVAYEAPPVMFGGPTNDIPRATIEDIFGTAVRQDNQNILELDGGGWSNDTFFIQDPPPAASPDAGSGEVIRKGYSVIFSDYAARTVYGTSGNDVIDEGGWVLGGKGDDAITGNAFSDTLIGGDGMDTLNGAAGDDTIDGGADADVINGGDGDDLLDGNTGSDVLNGGAGADTFVGGDGWDQVNYTDSQMSVIVDLENVITAGGAEGDRFNGIEAVAGSAYGDQLLGNGQNNNLIGGGGDDYMDGRAGTDWLFGEAGNDTLAGGLGGDFLLGGAGTDTADYRNALAGVTANLATGGTGGEADGDRFYDIENISGSNHDDQLTGDAGANTLSGRDGADLLDGGDGDDILIGGDGADTLIGGDGWDTASYAGSTSGVTVSLATGNAEGDVFSGVEGLAGTEFDDHLSGDAASNVLVGAGGGDYLDGGDGHDALYGGAGHDTLIGAAGDDAMNGDDGNDFLDGGSGDDTASGGAGSDVITGGSGHDVLDGGDGNDTLVGGHGNDTLVGGAGANTLDGGAGFDIASYAGASAGVVVSLAPGAKAQADSFTGIEGLSGSSHADRLTGDANGNLLEGHSGDDTLEGGDGADTLAGGAGLDTVSYADAASGVAASLVDGGTDGAAAGDVFESIENLSGSAHGDQLTGDGGGNVLSGQAGDDLLDGDAGNDTLDGGAGWDTATYQDAQAGVVASLAVGGSGGEAAGDTFSGVEALVGSSYDDRLTGDDAANVLSGAGGNDVLSGGRGNDSLDGGIGNDTLTGGDGADALTGGLGFDMASYQGAGAGVVASLASGGTGGDAAGDTFVGIEGLIGSGHGDRLTGNAGHNLLVGYGGDDVLSGGGGNDTLDGGEGFDIADYSTASASLNLDLSGGNSGTVLISIEGLTGSAFDDVLAGNGAANLLDGGAGNDVLRGSDGNDTLTGDRGSDIFVFDALLNGAGNVDAVTDFDFREDRIQLDSGIFTGLRSGPLDAAAFTLDKNATTADHRIIYHAETGELFYDADGTGRIEQVKFAVLVPGTVLSADLFMIA